jgi:hypothetical protein
MRTLPVALAADPAVRSLLAVVLSHYRLAQEHGCPASEFAVSRDMLRHTGFPDAAVEDLVEEGVLACGSPSGCLTGEGPDDCGGSWAGAPTGLWLTPAGLDCALRAEAQGAVPVAGCGPGGTEASPAAGRPHWDAVQWVLWWGATAVLRYRRSAANQHRLLDAFQAAGWPERIKNPLAGREGRAARGRLRQTVKSLNQHQRPRRLLFRVEANGQSVRWTALG